MKHIKLFETFDLFSTELYQIEKWIKSVWETLNTIEENKLQDLFKEIENCCGEDAAEIIDGMYDADKLHYYQEGGTVATGGIDTGEFIENFDNIKNDVEEILKKYTP